MTLCTARVCLRESLVDFERDSEVPQRPLDHAYASVGSAPCQVIMCVGLHLLIDCDAEVSQGIREVVKPIAQQTPKKVELSGLFAGAHG